MLTMYSFTRASSYRYAALPLLLLFLGGIAQAQITLDADGSVQGLKDLEGSPGGTPMIAMYDGTPSGKVGDAYQATSVGIVIFAVVANRNNLSSSLFTTGPGNGMTAAEIGQAFTTGSFGGTTIRPVGRTLDSGTRQTFDEQVLQEYYDLNEVNVEHDLASNNPVPHAPACGVDAHYAIELVQADGAWNLELGTNEGDKNTLISADYVGATVKTLREKHRCPVVYLTGTVGGLMTSLNVEIKSAAGNVLNAGA